MLHYIFSYNRYTTSQYKVLIDSLPPLITDEQLKTAFDRAGGGVQFLQIFHPERYEASQPCQHATILNKKMKKKTQMKQIIHSDTYAYVAFDSKETYDTLTKGDMRLFGMCIMDVRILCVVCSWMYSVFYILYFVFCVCLFHTYRCEQLVYMITFTCTLTTDAHHHYACFCRDTAVTSGQPRSLILFIWKHSVENQQSIGLTKSGER